MAFIDDMLPELWERHDIGLYESEAEEMDDDGWEDFESDACSCGECSECDLAGGDEGGEPD